ncbi:MAG: hypothetical protein ACR2KM_08785 [Gemmatimonadaceae bacterium]
MTKGERNAHVDALLHDAKDAENGRDFARRMQNDYSALMMGEAARELRSEAERLDPRHEAPAWQEEKDARAF